MILALAMSSWAVNFDDLFVGRLPKADSAFNTRKLDSNQLSLLITSSMLGRHEGAEASTPPRAFLLPTKPQNPRGGGEGRGWVLSGNQFII